MKVMTALLQKEWLEGWKSGKLVWLPIAMMIVGLTQPLTIYYMPDIIAHGGNLPDGMKISFTVPSGSEVMVSTLSQFNTLGMALIIFSVMGCVANERNQGVTALIMSRPVTAAHYIVSKWLTQSVIGILSFAAGYGLAYYYVRLLFEDASFSRFATSLGLYALWVIFIVTAGLAGSTIFRSVGAAAACGIGLTAAVSFAFHYFQMVRSGFRLRFASRRSISFFMESGQVFSDGHSLSPFCASCFWPCFLCGASGGMKAIN
ncbi:ABC transporter permease subunit [Bacillus subtilis subsp. subtilis]|nr:ABC transporter permease subunit [Bacillus subtilis]MBP3045592.1 ABC transporter permease subunit [Bacillus subtilis subsp. subtilis]MCB4338300.1 putative transmembrane protein YxlG [Bacillus subtilis]ODV46551.1 hypothetical protein BCM26_19910 [Bacillus subtilis]OTQ82034.1 membrane protein [Bacillus subtilis subsp. subtilis]